MSFCYVAHSILDFYGDDIFSIGISSGVNELAKRCLRKFAILTKISLDLNSSFSAHDTSKVSRRILFKLLHNHLIRRYVGEFQYLAIHLFPVSLRPDDLGGAVASRSVRSTPDWI